MTNYRGVVACHCVKNWLARLPKMPVIAGVLPSGTAVSGGLHDKRGAVDGPEKK